MRAAPVLLTIALLGCVQPELNEERAARLVAPDAAVRTELRAVVAAALGQDDVMLAADALTRDSVLLLERVPREGPAGTRLPGRELDEPERFVLLRVGGECVLEHVRTGRRWVLRDARCAALD